jgi:hypothetical protein
MVWSRGPLRRVGAYHLSIAGPPRARKVGQACPPDLSDIGRGHEAVECEWERSINDSSVSSGACPNIRRSTPAQEPAPTESWFGLI